jgi:hypothetical protein
MAASGMAGPSPCALEPDIPVNTKNGTGERLTCGLSLVINTIPSIIEYHL